MIRIVFTIVYSERSIYEVDFLRCDIYIIVEFYRAVAITLYLDIDLILTLMYSFIDFLVISSNIVEASILDSNFGFLCIVAVRVGKLCVAANGFACIIATIILNILRKHSPCCTVIDLKLHLIGSHFCRVDLPCSLSHACVVARTLDLYVLLANSRALGHTAYGVVSVCGENISVSVFIFNGDVSYSKLSHSIKFTSQ